MLPQGYVGLLLERREAVFVTFEHAQSRADLFAKGRGQGKVGLDIRTSGSVGAGERNFPRLTDL